MKSLRLDNLGGTLYKNDTPIARFKFRNNRLISKELLTDDASLLPFEFERRGLTENTIIEFFDARITPDTRIGLNEALAETLIKYYYPERMIRYNSGKCIHDRYWLECDDDDTCWK